MLLRKISSPNIKFLLTRTIHQTPKVFLKNEDEYENPILRTVRILSDDIMKPFRQFKAKPGGLVHGIPTHADIVIIGGGATGSSIAYWLKEKTNEEAFSVVVVEKDPTYKSCATCLSIGGLRQQFSLPENIQISLYGAEFIRTLKKRFGPQADVNFTPHGHLLLASEEGAEQLIDNSKLQKEFGAVNMVLKRQQIKDRFPWINVDDVAVGCLGLEKEGWFNPWALLHQLKNGAVQKNTQYVNAELVDFMYEHRSDIIIEGISENTFNQPRKVVIKTPDGQRKTISFAICIIAAGAESGKVAERLRIGTGDGLLTLSLPVERRKRFVYTFDCEKSPPGLNTPMTFDYTGAYFRRDGLGGSFIGGMDPYVIDDNDTTNSNVNQDFWETTLRPILANRVPAFDTLKMKNGWGGFYDYNRYDDNGIVGSHPYYTNIYMATGFSGYGIQQAPAVGRAIAELILDGRFQTIDLTRFGFDRLLMDKPMYEARIS